MPTPIGTGALFGEEAHQRFMRITLSRYHNMIDRLVKKKLIGKEHPPFSLEEFRGKFLAAMNGKEDGFVQCRFCSAYFGIDDLAADHGQPLNRRGSFGLDNIELTCRPCNFRKGSLTPTEYLALLNFLETVIPEGRIDVLKRLEQSVQLAAGQRSMAPVIKTLKDRGEWKKVQEERKAAKKAKEAGLGQF